MNSIECRIFEVLYDIKEPLTGYEIAKIIGAPISSTYYFLDKMAEKNIVVKFQGQGKKKTLYGLNPIFFSTEFWEKVIQSLKEIVEKMYELNCEFGYPDPEYALRVLINAIIKK